MTLGKKSEKIGISLQFFSVGFLISILKRRLYSAILKHLDPLRLNFKKNVNFCSTKKLKNKHIKIVVILILGSKHLSFFFLQKSPKNADFF